MTLTFNTIGWSQDEINYIQAAVCTLLAQQGIAHEGLKCVDDTCTIINPSATPSISESDVLAAKAANDELMALADAALESQEI